MLFHVSHEMVSAAFPGRYAIATQSPQRPPDVSGAFLRGRKPSRGGDLVLDALAVNHRARTRCERPGMTEVARHGDSGFKITMRSARSAGLSAGR